MHCEEKQQEGTRKQILQVPDGTRQQPQTPAAPVPALGGILGWKLEITQPNMFLMEHIPSAAAAAAQGQSSQSSAAPPSPGRGGGNIPLGSVVTNTRCHYQSENFGTLGVFPPSAEAQHSREGAELSLLPILPCSRFHFLSIHLCSFSPHGQGLASASSQKWQWTCLDSVSYPIKENSSGKRKRAWALLSVLPLSISQPLTLAQTLLYSRALESAVLPSKHPKHQNICAGGFQNINAQFCNLMAKVVKKGRKKNHLSSLKNKPIFPLQNLSIFPDFISPLFYSWHSQINQSFLRPVHPLKNPFICIFECKAFWLQLQFNPTLHPCHYNTCTWDFPSSSSWFFKCKIQFARHKHWKTKTSKLLKTRIKY